MTPEKTRMSLEEFMALPDDGNRHEVSEGELITMPPAQNRHCWTEQEINYLLNLHVRRNRLGRVYTSDMGFLLTAEPLTVRSPDVAFVAKERVLPPTQEGYFPGAPDLAVEVVSPSESMRDVRLKVDLYFQHGTRCVWVVYPDAEMVHIYEAPNRILVRRGDEPVTAEGVVAGFAVPAAQFFVENLAE